MDKARSAQEPIGHPGVCDAGATASPASPIKAATASTPASTDLKQETLLRRAPEYLPGQDGVVLGEAQEALIVELQFRLAQRSTDVKVLMEKLSQQQSQLMSLQARTHSVGGLLLLALRELLQGILAWLSDFRSRRRQWRNLRRDHERLKQAGLFDAAWYLKEYPDVARAGHDPLWHYLRWGTHEGRKPNALFDTRWYLARYPDVVASSCNPLVHYLCWGAQEGRDPSPQFSTSHYLRLWPDVGRDRLNPLAHHLSHRTAPDAGTSDTEGGAKRLSLELRAKRAARTARAAFEQLRGLDSDLNLSVTADQIDTLFCTTGHIHGMRARAWRRLCASLDKPYDRMIFMPWLVHGGADKVAVNLLKAAMETCGADSTLLVITDEDNTSARHWLPEGAHVRVLSEIEPGLTVDDRTELVVALIHSLQPKTVMNVNSLACWTVIARYGRALSRTTDLYATLFCRDYSPDGRSAGFADRFFRDCFDSLKGIYFDNQAFLRELCDQYGVPASRQHSLSVLYQPVEAAPLVPVVAPTARHPATGFRVLWMARICQQKNPELLMEIAAQMPHLQFDVYGDGDSAYVKALQTRAPRNVAFMGLAKSFESLPLERYDAFLYTSLWDGLPIVLLQVGAAGLPIVAPAIGGIPELVDEKTGWLVSDGLEARGFVQALEQQRQDRAERLRRTAAMRERVLGRHSWPTFVASLRSAPSFLE